MELEAPNVILITIDSLRYDHLGCYGYNRNTSPNIDALAAKGVRFLEAISNGGSTPVSFPSMMASILPPLEHAQGKTILARNATMAEVLRNAGYHTAAFQCNPFLSRLYGYQRGFEVFDDNFHQLRPWRARLWIRRIAKAPGGLITKAANRASLLLGPMLFRVWARPIVSAEEITNRATSWLQTHKGKFFLWLHYMDVHHPYMPAARYLSQFCDQSVSRGQMKALWHKMMRKPDELTPSEIEMLINLYDADIKYTDEIVGLLLDRLGNHLINTVVIVTADHGDEFGEHGNFGHHSVYDGILRVPLIIAGPGIKGGTLVKHQVSLIDLAPTIADLAGISSPSSFQGRSLLPVVEGKEDAIAGTISTFTDPRVERRSIAYRTPAWKYIETETSNASGVELTEELFDLRNDPGEIRNLHGESNGEADSFELEAKGRIAEFKQLKVEGATGYEKQRIRAKLKKLGKL